MAHTVKTYHTMNMEPQTYDFSYLKSWTQEELKKQLNAILPTIEFLVAMHNAKDKVVSMNMAYSATLPGVDMSVPSKVDPGQYSAVKEHTLHFNTFNTYKTFPLNFPNDLELFIHNFCTFLCAQKMHIEVLLTA